MRKSWRLLAFVVLAGCGGSTTISPDPEVWYPANIAPRFLPGSDFDFIQTANASPTRGVADPVVYTFATWGCNRISFGDLPNVPWTSTANQPWLAQLMADVEALPRMDSSLTETPPHLFFTGDLVLNEENDNGASLKTQMTAWSQFYREQPLWTSQTNLPFLTLGNHEAVYSTQVQPNVWKEYLPATDVNLRTWLGILRDGKFFVPPATPTKGIYRSAAAPIDQVSSNLEKDCSYSFDMGDLHFVVLNTDTYNSHMEGEHTSIGWVQLAWLDADLTSAEERGAERIFVFGHKPAVMFPGSEDGQNGDVQLNSSVREEFIDILNRHDKVAAYVCAHAHAWGTHRLHSPGRAKETMQLIAGNGGSILQDSWQPAGGTYFGPTLVKVYRSGRVVAESYGRPAPSPIYTPPTGPLEKRQEVQIFPSATE